VAIRQEEPPCSDAAEETRRDSTEALPKCYQDLDSNTGAGDRETTPLDDIQRQKQDRQPSVTSKTQNYDPVNHSSVPVIVEFWNYSHDANIREDGYKALRAVELAKKFHWDIGKISQVTGKQTPFLRKVFAVALALALVNGRGQWDSLVRPYAERVGLDEGTVRSLRYGLMCKAELSPVGHKGMDRWVKENLAEDDMQAIAEMVSTNSLRVYAEEIPAAVARGSLPNRCVRAYQGVPEDTKAFLCNSINVMRQMRDAINKGKFQGESLKEFQPLFNKFYAVVSETCDALKEALKREATKPAAIGEVAASIELDSGIDEVPDHVMRLVERCLPKNVPLPVKQQIAKFGLPMIYQAVAEWKYDGGTDIPRWIFMKARYGLADGRKKLKARSNSLDNFPLEPAANIG